MEFYYKTVSHIDHRDLNEAHKKSAIVNVCKDLSSYIEENMNKATPTVYVSAELLGEVCKKNHVSVKTFLQYIPHEVQYYYDSEDCFRIPIEDLYGENFIDFTESSHYSGLHGFFTKYYYNIANIKKRYLLIVSGICFSFDRGDVEKDFSIYLNGFGENFTETPITEFTDQIYDMIDFAHYADFQARAKNQVYDYYLENDDYKNTCTENFYDDVENRTSWITDTAKQEAEVYFALNYEMLELKKNMYFIPEDMDLEDFVSEMLSE